MLAGANFDPYLQGSCANYTIAWASSDVDIVVQLKDTYFADLSGLSGDERDRWRRNSGNPDYSWQEFRSDVVDILKTGFGSPAVDPVGKAIEVDTSKLPLNADVLVCANHQDCYNYPNGYQKGIVFFDFSRTPRRGRGPPGRGPADPKMSWSPRTSRRSAPIAGSIRTHSTCPIALLGSSAYSASTARPPPSESRRRSPPTSITTPTGAGLP